MPTPFLSEIISEKPRVEVLFEDGRLYNAADLLFCDTCSSLRSPLQILEVHERFYCPNCSNNFNLFDAPAYFNRCNRCFMCPRCAVTLSISSHLDPITQELNFFLKCPFCFWDSKSQLGLEKKFADKLVTDLLSTETNIPVLSHFTPLLDYYKKIATERAMKQKLKSILKDRYINYTGPTRPVSHKKPLSERHWKDIPYQNEINHNFDEHFGQNKFDIRSNIWDSQLPEPLKGIVKNKSVRIVDILKGKHLLKPTHEDNKAHDTSNTSNSEAGNLSLDKYMIDFSKSPYSGSDAPTFNEDFHVNNISNNSTLLQRLHFNFTNLPIKSRPSSSSHDPEENIMNYSYYNNNRSPFSSKGSLPSRLPLISISSKKCRFCKSTLLNQKNVINAAATDFAIDNRALLFIPTITISNSHSLFERGSLWINLTLQNPHESQIQVLFTFPVIPGSPIDVTTTPFEAQIEGLDPITQLMDDDDEEEIKVTDTKSPIRRSFQNRILVRLNLKVKDNTLGQVGYFHFKLTITFQDLLNNIHSVDANYIITLGKILQSSIKRIESF